MGRPPAPPPSAAAGPEAVPAAATEPAGRGGREERKPSAGQLAVHQRWPRAQAPLCNSTALPIRTWGCTRIHGPRPPPGAPAGAGPPCKEEQSRTQGECKGRVQFHCPHRQKREAAATGVHLSRHTASPTACTPRKAASPHQLRRQGRHEACLVIRGVHEAWRKGVGAMSWSRFAQYRGKPN